MLLLVVLFMTDMQVSIFKVSWSLCSVVNIFISHLSLLYVIKTTSENSYRVRKHSTHLVYKLPSSSLGTESGLGVNKDPAQ